jgi:hypothetical protein
MDEKIKGRKIKEGREGESRNKQRKRKGEDRWMRGRGMGGYEWMDQWVMEV